MSFGAQCIRLLRRLTPLVATYVVLLLRWACFVVHERYVRNVGAASTPPTSSLAPWPRLIADAGLWGMFSLFVSLTIRAFVDRKSIGTGTDMNALLARRRDGTPDPRDKWEYVSYRVECGGIAVLVVSLLVLCFADVFAPRLGLAVFGAFVFAPLAIATAYVLLMFFFRLLVGDAHDKAMV